MKFTPIAPVMAGFYAWRFNNKSAPFPLWVDESLWVHASDGGTYANERGGEWSLLVYADDHVPTVELREAYREGYVAGHDDGDGKTNLMGRYETSRTRRIAEGKK